MCVCVCVLKSHFKGFLPILLPWAVSPRRPLPGTWITRSENFLSVSTLILACTVLLDPQPEGRHSGEMRIREGDESARSGLGVSSSGSSSSKVWEARCGWRPRREPTAGQTGFHSLEQATSGQRGAPERAGGVGSGMLWFGR